jgi:hypothetical protein
MNPDAARTDVSYVRRYVVTFSGHNNDGSEYASHPSEVPDNLGPLFQIDVPDNEYALDTIIAIVRKELGA